MMNDQTIEIVQDNFEAGGKLVRASFLFVDGGRVTECILHDYRRVDVPAPVNGVAVCNPSDTLDRSDGMRRAMRRACVNLKEPEQWGQEFSKLGSRIYQAYRKHLHEAEKPAHYVIYNHEVRGVTEAQHAAWIEIVSEESGECGKKNGYGCTRGGGHTGIHIATGLDIVFQVWDDGVELSYDEWLKLDQERHEREAKK